MVLAIQLDFQMKTYICTTAKFINCTAGLFFIKWIIIKVFSLTVFMLTRLRRRRRRGRSCTETREWQKQRGWGGGGEAGTLSNFTEIHYNSSVFSVF